MPSWHRQYRGRNIGRVLHFLYHYCGFDVAEMATIGCNNVKYNGELIALYDFLSDTDIPYFTFLSTEKPYDKKEMYEENQRNKFHIAIGDADNSKKEPCNECRTLKLKLSMLEARDEVLLNEMKKL